MGLLSRTPTTSPVPPAPKTISLSFSDAIGEILNKKKITRAEWNDVEEYGYLKDEFLTIHTKGKDHRWLVSEADMISVDWIAF